MATVLHHKVVSSLPNPLEANSIYFVRVGAGVDLYVTNSSGTVVAYALNTVGIGPEETGERIFETALVWGESVPYVGVNEGERGKTAYEVAVDEGFVGSEQDWLDSLVGPEGPEGSTGKAAAMAIVFG